MPIMLIGCAGNGSAPTDEHPDDPYESMNRQVFAFNEEVDRYVFNPIISTYQTCLPNPIRVGIHNVYFNMAEIAYATNFYLQGDFENGYNETMRVLVNSTFGCGGIFDMAANLGLPRKKNDFGKTLYLAGYTESAYYVAPFFGPMTIRDSYGMCVDKVVLSPLSYVNSPTWRNELFVLSLIDTKANLAEHLQKLTSLPYIEDKYSFVRDSYLQYRNYQLQSGQVNWDSFYDDLSDEPSDHEEEPIQENN